MSEEIRKLREDLQGLVGEARTAVSDLKTFKDEVVVVKAETQELSKTAKLTLEGYGVPVTILLLSAVALLAHYTLYAGPAGVGAKAYLTGGARWFFGYLKTAFGQFGSDLGTHPEAAIVTLRNWLWPLGPVLAFYGYLRMKVPDLFQSVKTGAAQKLWPKEARDRISKAEEDGETYRTERDKAIENQNSLQIELDKAKKNYTKTEASYQKVLAENQTYADFVANDPSVRALWDLKHGNK